MRGPFFVLPSFCFLGSRFLRLFGSQDEVDQLLTVDEAYFGRFGQFYKQPVCNRYS